jgi:hypothetical protein
LHVAHAENGLEESSILEPAYRQEILGVYGAGVGYGLPGVEKWVLEEVKLDESAEDSKSSVAQVFELVIRALAGVLRSCLSSWTGQFVAGNKVQYGLVNLCNLDGEVSEGSSFLCVSEVKVV